MKNKLTAWRTEYNKQKREHPWASSHILKRIASDHIKKGGR